MSQQFDGTTIGRHLSSMMDEEKDGLPTSVFWLEKAEEARALAASMKVDKAKATMANIAAMYAAMARLAAIEEARS